MNFRRIRAFTLIEILLAVAIMSSVLVLAGTAYQLYTQTWRKDLANIEQAFAKFRFNALWLDACKAIIPLSVRTSRESSQWGFYFLGREEGFTAVTSTPVFNTGYPAVIRIFREQASDGQFRLIYEEASMRGMVLLSADQVLPFSHRQILLTSAEPITFSYFGWTSLQDKMAAGTEFSSGTAPARPQWFTEYDGMARQYQPDIIQLRLGASIVSVTLPNRAVLGLRRALSEESV